MQIVIDIPEELAKKEHWYTDKEIWTVIKAAQNGTPLDDIKAEIEQIEINGQVDEHTMFIRGGSEVKQLVLKIIDKHIK